MTRAPGKQSRENSLILGRKGQGLGLWFRERRYLGPRLLDLREKRTGCQLLWGFVCFFVFFFFFFFFLKKLKIRNASRICVSSLRRGHANLLCIVPILVYVLPKRALSNLFLFS